RPARPPEGVDRGRLPTANRAATARPPLLYFDNWDLQCARWMDWKLHLARHNTAAYTPAPPGGRHSFLLPRPELYNLAEDPDESYDVAAENPLIVARIRGRIDAMLAGFPEPVQKAWAEAKARSVDPALPAAAWPQPVRR